MSRVLIVDDDPDVRSLLRDLLELEDLEVVEAADGPAALSAVTTENPECVVLDIMMPGMSGLDVLRNIRSNPATQAIPVILLTALTDDETTWAGWTSGASVFLPKPFEPGPPGGMDPARAPRHRWSGLPLSPAIPGPRATAGPRPRFGRVAGSASH